MTSIPDLDAVGKIHDRTGVVVVAGYLCQRAQHIKRSDRLRGFLNAMHLGGDLFADRYEDLVFQRCQPLLRAQHGAFELLEFLSDIAFAVGERLLADIILRHSVRVGFADLYVIAEYAVIADLELADTGPFTLALLDRRDLPLAAGGEVAQVIDFFMVASTDQAALAQ